jgi:hypothetical protein
LVKGRVFLSTKGVGCEWEVGCGEWELRMVVGLAHCFFFHNIMLEKGGELDHYLLAIVIRNVNILRFETLYFEW